MITSKEKKNRYSSLKFENQHGGCRGYGTLSYDVSLAIVSLHFGNFLKRLKTKMPRHQYRIPRPVRQ